MQTKNQISLKPQLCYFAQVKSPDKGVRTFGILEEDRRNHIYILGKTGMGKTSLLQNMVLQDIYNNQGICFIDPHGDSAEYILDRIPTFRKKDVVYLNPADTDFPVGLNILEAQNNEQKFLIASQMLDIFKRIWQGMWSSRMEYILNNTILALLEYPNSTLLDVVKVLTDKKFRTEVIDNLKDPLVKNFWTKEFSSFNSRYRQEAISPILNKIGQFLSTDLIRHIVGQKTSSINFRTITDESKILIVNLSKGRLGEENSNLLGSLVVSQLQLAALSRVDIPEKKRKDFYLYVDEFQNFTTDSFATILSEARKYRLNLIIAHQYISQLSESGNEKVKNSIFGNIGTIISFRIGTKDAKVISQEFTPVFDIHDLIELERTEIALSMSIKNKKSKPFKARTLAPIFETQNGYFQANKDYSRGLYGRNKDLIHQIIQEEFQEEIIQNPSSKQNKKNKNNEKKNQKGKAVPDMDQKILKNFPETLKKDSQLNALKKARNTVATGKWQKSKNKVNKIPDISDDQLFTLPS